MTDCTTLSQASSSLSFNCSNDTTPAATMGLPSGGDNFNLVVSSVVAALFALTTALGLLGNLLVILVVTFNKKMKNSTNYLVLNLAFADLMFIIIAVPFTAVKYATPVWVFGDIWCRIVNYTAYVCTWASSYTLVLMSLDRVLAIVFAIRLPNVRTKRNVTIAITLVWALVLLANIPTWMFHGVVEYEYNNVTLKTCNFLSDKVDNTSTLVFHFCYFVFGFVVPVIAISILYGMLVMFLMGHTAPTRGSSVTNKTKKRVTIMVIVVVAVFVVCWLPLHVILVMTHTGKYPMTKGHVAVLIAANCLAYMNSCMNPVLYMISSSAFRKAFKEFLCCKTCPVSSIFYRGSGRPDGNSATPISTHTKMMTVSSPTTKREQTPFLKPDDACSGNFS